MYRYVCKQHILLIECVCVYARMYIYIQHMMHMLYNLLINYYNFILAHFRARSARTFNFTIIPIIFIHYYHYNKYIIINMNIFNHYHKHKI